MMSLDSRRCLNLQQIQLTAFASVPFENHSNGDTQQLSMRHSNYYEKLHKKLLINLNERVIFKILAFM